MQSVTSGLEVKKKEEKHDHEAEEEGEEEVIRGETRAPSVLSCPLSIRKAGYIEPTLLHQTLPHTHKHLGTYEAVFLGWPRHIAFAKRRTVDESFGSLQGNVLC